ncbi:Peptidoglycan/LPS O-acetylase OafA/YrhL, contains acyltransferase and SGNH-hydrolase domains [Collimonas sp. OK607]|uniref:acyltransferase family protein n=1 Tax=Collimonas sp. OK607 TaxID=1798194 RepID=UPI0008E1F4F5|nr:acyltransferase [Collimonas sp. OK607]SFB27108.1 Peptidoglycan/LPS O-acetylase OafA/YrhL, contains acyltransferase and SGNH-hydrolase domains [Collimonas sp. OK607]
MKNRLHEIDGIRGWAALVVLFFHLMNETFGNLVPMFRSDFIYFLSNGGLAVTVFFILSGDALSSGFSKKADLTLLDSLLIKRYFRLTVPILLSCAIVYVLMLAGANYSVAAAKIVHREDWLGSFIPFEPSLISLLRYSFYLVYDGHSKIVSYNPFLWTMSIELVGSLLVFLYLYLSTRLKNPIKILYAVIIFLVIAQSFYCLFFIGVLFAQYRANGVFNRLRASGIWRFAAIALLIAIVIIYTFSKRQPYFWQYININVVTSAALVFCFYTSDWAIGFFSSKLSHFLGEISFPLYLVHFSVIISLTSFLTIKFSELGTLDTPHIFLIIFVSIAASITAAVIFRRVEKSALKLINRLPAHLLSMRNPSDSSLVQKDTSPALKYSSVERIDS